LGTCIEALRDHLARWSNAPNFPDVAFIGARPQLRGTHDATVCTRRGE